MICLLPFFIAFSRVTILTGPVPFARLAKMSPLISKSDYNTYPLYNLKHRKVYITDLVQIEDKHLHRMSDLTTGMLIVSTACRAIQKTQVCYFCVPLLVHVSLRKIYEYEGRYSSDQMAWQ
jgi:hypothetical protein